jgi:hypothetical protein
LIEKIKKIKEIINYKKSKTWWLKIQKRQKLSNVIETIENLCLVLLQVAKCFVPVQIFWASPNIWLHLVHLQKLLCRHKNQFYWMEIIFLSGTKCLWLPQYVNKFLVWHKQFGPAQNILGSVKGQGMKWLPIFGNFCDLCDLGFILLFLSIPFNLVKLLHQPVWESAQAQLNAVHRQSLCKIQESGDVMTCHQENAMCQWLVVLRHSML